MSKKKLAGIIVACIIAIIAAILIINRTHTLTTDINTPGAGSVSPLGGEYKSGVQVRLTASPASGYTFDHWQGDVVGTSPFMTVTMTRNMSITAHFSRVPPKLVILSHEGSAEMAFPDLLHFTVKGQAQNAGVYTIRSVTIVVKCYTQLSVALDFWVLQGEVSSSYYDIEPNQIFDFEVNADFDTLSLAKIGKYEISVVDIQY